MKYKKTFRIDNFTIRCTPLDGNSNYELRTYIYEDKKIISGAMLKNGSSDLEILEFAIDKIKNKEKNAFSLD